MKQKKQVKKVGKVNKVKKVCPADCREVQLGKQVSLPVGVLLTEIERLKNVVKNIQSFL